MKFLKLALLYTGLMLGANAALAGPMQEVIATHKGEALKGLAVHGAPRPLPEAEFDAPGGKAGLEMYRGQIVVLNFWAVWCAPCREEMATLSALEAEFGGEEFAVVTLATGPNALPAIDKFFAEVAVDNLPKYRDPRSVLARGAGVFGLPVTMILDREGRELARLVGPADWHSEAARALVAGLIAAPAGSDFR
ncbi:TlpA disulfide reductase family protein [Pseudooceanicola sp.]|uniref:TlpA family protein disulfide reductase n=1 Tax=Pseudooceanicola sp. TaxID=1914328 RepID=UPI002624FDD7|nr:TlpA disulfide reductase family protein [Pseudooceanicola sp.]MDF1855311.1 TlpA disulfide reductase family protein [Pseudooceanicola sp.]